MTVNDAQRRIDSVEFAEWRAYFRLADEAQTGDHGEPTPDQLSSKIQAWAAAQKSAGKDKRR